MTDPRQAVQRFIDTLERCRTRSAMLVGRTSVERIIAFFNGANLALGCCLDNPSGHNADDIWLAVLYRRQLRSGATGMAGVADQLRDRGMTEEQVVEELIAIEIENWRRWLDAWPTVGLEDSAHPT
jgi:hypothetical protein